ncbi:MAG: radical SAM protein [Candidatus Aenigmarchaeota archaeon]|nr:radical SAM protein [Candidatus Aenigmarchaeota archaeon]
MPNLKTNHKHQSTAKDLTENMAYFIEVVLGNPIIRKVLRFCTSQCENCGRRFDLCLKKYMGYRVKLCSKCKIAYFIVKNIFDYILNQVNIPREDVETSLKDPMWRRGLSSVLEGIAKYGPTKPFIAYSPFLVVWNVTKICNLRCKHCYAIAGVPPVDELNKKEALMAVDKMSNSGVAYIALSGGEPLMRKDFWNIVNRIKKNEMAFSIATNGTLLTKRTAKKLKDWDCLYVQVSLDGAKPTTHNRFRGANAFKRTIQGIKNAVDAKICVGIATTVTKINYKEVAQIINLAENLGAEIFMHYNFIPVGRGKEIAQLDISPEEREKLLNMLASQIGKRKISLLSTAPQYGRVCTQFSAFSLTHFDNISQMKEYKNSVNFLGEFVGGCGTGRLYCALDYNGDITPCVFIPIKLGNIKKDDFLDIWHNSQVFNQIRNRNKFKGACGTCKYKNICGGCRARAYGYHHDITKSDPGCVFNKKEWIKIIAK